LAGYVTFIVKPRVYENLTTDLCKMFDKLIILPKVLLSRWASKEQVYPVYGD